jgi:hypothetical protein
MAEPTTIVKFLTIHPQVTVAVSVVVLIIVHWFTTTMPLMVVAGIPQISMIAKSSITSQHRLAEVFTEGQYIEQRYTKTQRETMAAAHTVALCMMAI